jgi:hypothetical protein
VNEIFNALDLLKKAVGKSKGQAKDNASAREAGEKILEEKTPLNGTEILAEGFENSNRKVLLIKVTEAYHAYKEFIIYYGVTELMKLMKDGHSFEKMIKMAGEPVRDEWINVGGQLIPKPLVDDLTKNIHDGKINSWDEVHDFFVHCGDQYSIQKTQHAFASLLEILKIAPGEFTPKVFMELTEQAVTTKERMVKAIIDSRTKDYENEFRKMVYESKAEMEAVIGKLKDNTFIIQQQNELKQFKKQAEEVEKLFLVKQPA